MPQLAEYGPWAPAPRHALVTELAAFPARADVGILTASHGPVGSP